MKIGAIILSRLDSSRLPGKALIEVAGKSIFGYVHERASKINGIAEIVLATTKREVDDPLVVFAKNKDILCFRGNTQNVAKRVLSCCERFSFDAFVRINGDSPLLHYELIETAIAKLKENRVDIVTNVFPRSFPTGMSVEVVTYAAYLKAYSKMKIQSDFEHVTTFIYNNSEQFSIFPLHNDKNDWSGIHLAVDTKEDLEKFRWIISRIPGYHTLASISDIIDISKQYTHKKL